jgi:hypothetical protein
MNCRALEDGIQAGLESHEKDVFQAAREEGWLKREGLKQAGRGPYLLVRGANKSSGARTSYLGRR